MQQAAAQLPWGHNLVLLDKLPGPETRRWYAAQAIPTELQTSLPSIEQIERELACDDTSAQT
ncbi:hypothetical protein GCM10009091_01860 [Pseudomonas brenneri]|uniref:YhcG N-terminal domain-containing protein n=1 Tax=Pseudomonas brenneri TaxID=129817 RepID=A0ABY0WB51_9PSED|nr:hypothetical protein GCM10009091_01860 [Pseudomonas brenneri]SDU94230.1 hypothetical protein SAMN04490181_1904 [Pseudomonas brenneri]